MRRQQQQPPHSRREPLQIKRGVDPLDLTLGLVGAILLPILTYAILIGTGYGKTKSDVGQFREKRKVQVEMDAELVGIQLEYYRKIRAETALEFIRVAEETPVGTHRLNIRDWAKRSLKYVIAGLTTIESQINNSELAAKLAGPLRNVQELRERCKADLAAAAEIGT